MKRMLPHIKTRLIALCLLLAPCTIGQTPPLQKLTLEGAISRALNQSPDQKIQQLRTEEAKRQLTEAKLRHIPHIFASGDLRRNLIIPFTPVPAHIFNPDAEEGETMYLQFSTEWNATAGLNLDYDLFSPDKIYAASEREQQLKVQEYDARITEEDITASVALAYVECVIALEQLRSLESDMAYFSTLFQRADTLYRRGRITLIEKNESHVALNEAMADYLMAEKIADDRKAALLSLMGEDLTAESIKEAQLTEDIPALLQKMESSFTGSQPSLPLQELKQQEMVDLAALRVKAARLKHAPTLTLIGFLGGNHYHRSFDLFNQRHWRGHSYVGLSVSIPLTQSFQIASESSRLRLQQQIESETLRNLRNENTREQLNEQSLLEVRRKQYLLALENLELSHQNMRAAEVQYEKGHILQQDLLSEQRALRATRQNYLLSAHDVITSYITLLKNRSQNGNFAGKESSLIQNR